MAAPRVELSETELTVLKALWESGPATVREIHEKLGTAGRAYTTVLTFLMRLEAKGYVASEKSGLAHVFRAIVTRDDLLRQRLGGLTKDLCDGAATPLLRALVQGQRFSSEDIDQLRRLLDDLEKSPAPDRPVGKSKRKR